MDLLLSDEPQLIHLFLKALGNLMIVCVYRPMPRYHHNVVAQQIGFLRQAISLPDAAADAVSYHGMTELCAGGQTKPVIGKPVFPAINHQAVTGSRFSLLVQPAEQVILFKGSCGNHGTALPSK